MARSDYIVRIKGDLSQLKSEVAEAKGEIQRLNDDEVLIRLDFKDGDVAALQKVIDSIIKSDPTLTVQLNYDLQTRSLQDQLKEQQRLLDLSHMLSGQLDGSNDIERAVKTIVEEVNDGLDKGLKKTDLQEKLKKAINLSDSYTEATGKQLSESVLSRLEEVRAKFPRLENYEGDFSYFDKLDERMKSNKVIIDGLQESLKQLQQKGAVRTDKIIDLHNLEEGAEYADKLLDKAEDAKKRLETSTGSRKITYFDGFKEQIYDTISDAEKLDDLLDDLASKWGEVGFRSATDYVNKKGRVTDNLYDQLQSGYDSPSLGSWTYFTQNYKDALEWDTDVQRKMFAANLEGIEKLLRAESDEYMESINSMFGSMHALIAKDIFPDENYSNILEQDEITDVKSLYSRYQEQFQDFGVTQEKLSQFIQSQTEWLSQFNTSTGEIPNELKSAESFSSKFVKEVLGLQGISTSNLGANIDSTYLGTAILDSIAAQLPHIDFGDNKEIAQKFAEKMFGKIIQNKAQNPNVDLGDVLRQYTGVDTKTFKTGDIDKMAQTSIYDIDAFKKMYQNYQDALEIQKNAIAVSTKDLNAGLLDNSSIDDSIQKLERLLQLQNTIANMKQDSAYGKSYEEAGKHIEKLNAQYEQTIAEIDKLKAMDDGSAEIKEQIGLLENLAVAQRNAIEASFPNDVVASDFLRKYSNLSFGDLFGEEAFFKFREIHEEAENFNKSLQQDILDVYKSGQIPDDFVPKDINTSALTEIPEIMDRINTAGKEASQTIDELGSSMVKSNDEISTASSDEVDQLRQQNEQLQQRVEEAEREVAWAQDSSQKAWDEYSDVLDRAERAEHDLREAQRKTEDLEYDLSTKGEQHNAHVLDYYKGESQSLASKNELLNSMYDDASYAIYDAEEKAQEYFRAMTDLEDKNKSLQKEIENLQSQQTELSEQETKETDSDSIRKDTEQTEKNTEAHRENAKAKEESSEAGSDSSSSTEQTLKDTEETDKNTQAHKENEQAKEQSSKAGSSSTSDSTEQTQKDTEETERNTKAHKENEQAKKDAAQASSGDNSYEDSTNNIDDEIAALGRLKSAAEEAAAAKEAVRAANEGLGGSAEETSSDLGKEAQAMNDVSSSGDKASSSKEDVKTANEKLGSSADTSSGKLDNEAESINGVDEEAKKIKENTERYYKLLNDAFDVRNFVQGDADLTRMFGDDNVGIIGALNDMFSSPEEAFTANGKQYLDDLEIFVNTVKNSVHEAAIGMDSDIDAFTKAMGTLYSGKNDYFKNLKMQATSQDGFDSIGKQIADYEAGIKSVSTLIDSMKAKWGENSDIVSNATKAFAKYQQDTTANMAQDIAKQAQQQIDKIDRAMKTRGEQGSGFMAEYAQRLDEAKTNAQGIVEALAHGTPPPDSGEWKTWLSTLESGKNTLKEINDQSNLLATQNQLSKLLTKVNQDIEKGAQYGQLGDSYAKLKSDVEGALSSLKSANDAGEALSKIDFRNFADAYQQLHATGVEIGAFKGTFLSKFSDAITNQSAQFLATYFSFQDMIRYGKEVVNTVVQTDSALTELKKVSDASNERIQQSFQTSAETAQELGSTITDVINSTSDWARMGYSIDEAEKLSRVTTLFQTVGDNMTQETASESLVSILQGFNIDAKDSERVLDSINEVSNNFAIDTRGGLSCPVTWKHVA